jgi:hypothetical protein
MSFEINLCLTCVLDILKNYIVFITTLLEIFKANVEGLEYVVNWVGVFLSIQGSKKHFGSAFDIGNLIEYIILLLDLL